MNGIMKRITVFTALAFTLFVAFAPVAYAQDFSTPVTSDGTVLEEFAGASVFGVNSFRGTGVMTPDLLAEAGGGLSYDDIKKLRPIGAGVGIESVIGSDTRFRVGTPYNYFPARATALITSDAGWCTGWFIGANTVATAGHCVHSGGSTGKWMTNVRVYPAYDAGYARYGSYPAKWLASVYGWTRDRNEQYDYGVVKLSSSIGTTVGWFGFWWQTASLTGQPVRTNGYPGDKTPTKSMWTISDIVRTTTDRQLFYECDTFGGQSGSPLWQDRKPGSAFCTGSCAMGIHAYGLHGAAPHGTNNHGTRITSAVFNNLITWRNAP